jgi:hypothetical protein
MKVCIVCEKDVEGKSAVPIKEDAIIRTIRGVKQFFRIAANNELYVCEDDIPKHMEKRRGFERSLIFFGVLAALVVILLAGSLVLSGHFDIVAFLFAIVLGLLILVFAVVFKYAPAIEQGPAVVGGKPRLPDELKELDEEEAAPARKGKAKAKQSSK